MMCGTGHGRLKFVIEGPRAQWEKIERRAFPVSRHRAMQQLTLRVAIVL